MPVQAFLGLIERLTELERTAAGDAPAAGAAALSFPMGRLLARCARCDGTSFLPVDPAGPLRMTSELACAACAERVIHGELIARLGTEIVQQARALAVARAKQPGGRRARVVRLDR